MEMAMLKSGRLGIAACSLGLCVSALGAPAFSDLRAADGSRSFAGRPVAVVSQEKGIIRIERESGETVDRPLSAFADPDRKRLQKWMKAVAKDPLPALAQRLKAAREPAVLFVGNSYSFKVPTAFRKLAAAEGRRVRVEQVTKGGWTLAKHAGNPETLEKIREGGWDAVVIQEQSLIPSFPALRRDASMLPAARKLVKLICESGAVPVIYQTWARRDGDGQNAVLFPDDTFAAMDKRLATGFASLRRSIPELAPVRAGDAWAEVVGQGKGAALYAPDGSHPSVDGVRLTAALFYTTLFDARFSDSGTAGDFRKTAERLGCWQPPELPGGS
jgi:hypothetical protein